MATWAAILIGACVGAVVSFAVSLSVAHGNRRHSYYDRLILTMSEHNWNLMLNGLKPGLPVTNISPGVSIVCYQHINLLFLVWLNRSYASRDGSMEGWRRWASAIKRGSKLPENEEFKACYRQILVHGDLYPAKFTRWLSDDMRFSAADFYGVDDKSEVDGRDGAP